jgi:hypothetical protein
VSTGNRLVRSRPRLTPGPYPRPGSGGHVGVADVGEGTAQLRADIDAADRTKNGSYGSSSAEAMVAEAAAVATLQLSRE